MKDKTPEKKFDMAYKLYVNGNYEEAFKSYLALAEEGYSTCQTFVAWLYLKGCGTNKSRSKAFEWYKKAANSNDAEAQFFLARLYAEDKDIEKSVKWYSSSASLNYPPSQYRLGCYYESGHGVALDKKKAFVLFELSANEGHIFAKKAYAVRLMKGRKGIFGFFKGLWIYVAIFFITIKVMSDDPDSERLRI